MPRAPFPSLLKRDCSAGAAQDTANACTVVSYMLPLHITKVEGGDKPTWAIEWNNDSIVAKSHRALSGALARVTWVGCPHVDHDLSPADMASLSEALRPLGCIPVFLDARTHHGCYFECCRKTLWPLFHNVVRTSVRPEQLFSPDAWRDYTTVNKAFADVVVGAYDGGELVWVHDYHLLLLPSLLLRKLRTASVGLFLHTPFPSSEIFRAIPVRDELLRGMLNADLIGFHLYEYARSFLTCCQRMLGLDFEYVPGGFLAIQDQRRTIIVQASHVGVEPEVLAPHLRPVDAPGPPPGLDSPAIAEAATAGRAAGAALIGGVDECDRLRGIPLKLLAFERLLETRPAWRGKACFLQVLVGARNFLPARSDDSAAVRADVEAIAQRINSLYPGSVVMVDMPTISLGQRMALWALLKVAIFSAVREGVNTYPLEYVYARSGEGAGVVVLSEFCSCGHVLNGALRVNVWSCEDLALAMERALTMEAAERIARQQRDLLFVITHTTSSWALRFVDDLRSIVVQKADEAASETLLGFGFAGLRSVGMGGMRPLEVTDVLASYRKTLRRAIFVDWGGTIVANDGDTETYAKSSLPFATRDCLEGLCSDPRNLIMVVSGMERSHMDAAFGGLPGISLAAEHGLFYRLGSRPGTPITSDAAWAQVMPTFDESWREGTQSIMKVFAQRTNGAYVQRKGASVVWRYEGAEEEFASLQAKELRDHLEALVQGQGVVVNQGKGFVEVKPKGVDKGVIVDLVLEQVEKDGGVDFVLVMGDDVSDEHMFDAVLARKPASASVYCCTVGRKPSSATYYLNDTEEVLGVLRTLSNNSIRSSRNRSLSDLHSDFRRVMRTAPSDPSQRTPNALGIAGGFYTSGGEGFARSELSLPKVSSCSSAVRGGVGCRPARRRDGTS